MQVGGFRLEPLQGCLEVSCWSWRSIASLELPPLCFQNDRYSRQGLLEPLSLAALPQSPPPVPH